MYKANNKASIKFFSSFSVILSFDENYFHKFFIAVYTADFRGGGTREVLHRDTNKIRPRALFQDINNTPSLSVTDDDRQPSVTILIKLVESSLPLFKF